MRSRVLKTCNKTALALTFLSVLAAAGPALADPPGYPPRHDWHDGHHDYDDRRPHWNHRHIRRVPPPVVVVQPPVRRYYYYYEPAPVVVTPPPPPPSGMSLIVPLYFR